MVTEFELRLPVFASKRRSTKQPQPDPTPNHAQREVKFSVVMPHVRSRLLMKLDSSYFRHEPWSYSKRHKEYAEKRTNRSPASRRQLLFHREERANKVENDCNNGCTTQRPEPPEPHAPKDRCLTAHAPNVCHDIFMRVSPLEVFNGERIIAVRADCR